MFPVSGMSQSPSATTKLSNMEEHADIKFDATMTTTVNETSRMDDHDHSDIRNKMTKFDVPIANYTNQRSMLHSSVDWRKQRPGRKAKLSYVLQTDLFADVVFAVGSEKIPVFGHRFMLVLYSSVFEAMFHGDFAKEGLMIGSEPISVPDIEPHAFRTMVQYIYTREFDTEMTSQEALDVLYAAKKYDITELEVECTHFLKDRVTQENAVSIFQSAQLLDEAELRDEVHSFITRNFDSILLTDDFLTMTHENLCTFLDHDDTHGCELDIFSGVLRWAVAECTRQSLPQCAENHRLVLKEGLNLVRFPVISSEDIALHVIPTGVLTPAESTLLFQHLVVSPDNRSLLSEIPFNVKKRNCSIYVVRFYEDMARTAYVDISAGWYNKFSVDQAVSIISFGFYGPHSVDSAAYDVSTKLMKDSSDSEVMAEAKQHVFVKAKEVFHVRFPKPVPILSGHSYRAWFSLKGPLTCHGTTATPSQEVFVAVKGTRYNKVRFHYTVTGAHQLPEIAFQI